MRKRDAHANAYILQRTAPVWKEAIEAATRAGHLPVLRWATELERGRGPWKANFDNVLEVAATYGHVDIVKWLLKRGVDSYVVWTMLESDPGYYERVWRYQRQHSFCLRILLLPACVHCNHGDVVATTKNRLKLKMV
ncbi:unnamed protein product [Phytophthora lilii]|uniref:Unnamed protein product n=1 Tax=Phytophthora lilii TaxID=2077276 RepID=A0A9W7CQ85_9STRA|nr:unnamed protein product [Phytophthora lilii]